MVGTQASMADVRTASGIMNLVHLGTRVLRVRQESQLSRVGGLQEGGHFFASLVPTLSGWLFVYGIKR